MDVSKLNVHVHRPKKSHEVLRWKRKKTYHRKHNINFKALIYMRSSKSTPFPPKKKEKGNKLLVWFVVISKPWVFRVYQTSRKVRWSQLQRNPGGLGVEELISKTCGWTSIVFPESLRISWVWPLPSNRDHQDYYILVGNPFINLIFFGEAGISLRCFWGFWFPWSNVVVSCYHMTFWMQRRYWQDTAGPFGEQSKNYKTGVKTKHSKSYKTIKHQDFGVSIKRTADKETSCLSIVRYIVYSV